MIVLLSREVIGKAMTMSSLLFIVDVVFMSIKCCWQDDDASNNEV